MSEKIVIEYELSTKSLKSELKSVESSLKETEKVAQVSSTNITKGFEQSAQKTQSLKAQLRELKAQLAETTDPKEFQRLAQAAGDVQDKISDASAAAKAFAADTKASTAKTLFGQMAGDLANLDFKAAADKSKQFLGVVQSITFKESLQGVKALGTTLGNIGKALLTSPLFLIGGAIALIVTQFDKLKNMGGVVGKVFSTIGDLISQATQKLKQFSDFLGFTNFQLDEQTSKVVENAKRQQKAIEEKYGKEIALAKAAGKETIDLEIAKQRAIIAASGAAVKQYETAYKQKKKLSDSEMEDLKAQIETLNKANTEIQVLKVTKEKKSADEIKKINEKLNAELKVLRDLRTQNIVDNYERERQALLNRFSDEADKYKKNKDILVELEKQKSNELYELNKKYNKNVIQNVDKLTEILNRSKTEEVDVEMKLKDVSVAIAEEKKAKKIRIAKETEEEIKEILAESIMFAQTLNADIAQIRSNQIQAEIDLLLEKSDIERNQLDSDLQYGLISREQYAEKIKQINEKQAAEERRLKEKAFKANQTAAYIAATISTAQGIANALGTQPPNLVPLAVALAAATGAAQMAVIASQPTPKFAKGGEIGGRLHTQGGTIIEAEKGEYVINRKSTSKHYELIEAINKGKAERYIQQMYIAPLLKNQSVLSENNKSKSFADNIAQSMILNSRNFNDANLLDSMKTSRQQDKENIKYLAKVLTRQQFNSRKH